MFCTSCGTKNPDGEEVCYACGNIMKPVSNNQNVNPAAQLNSQLAFQPVAKPALGWANFLGYFALWGGALFNLINAISSMTGAQYGLQKRAVYRFFPGLRIMDIVFGLVCLTLVALQIIAAISIIKRRKNAVTLVPVVYAVSFLISFIYDLIGSKILHQSLFTLTVIIALVVNLAFFFINLFYFKKKKQYFTN